MSAVGFWRWTASSDVVSSSWMSGCGKVSLHHVIWEILKPDSAALHLSLVCKYLKNDTCIFSVTSAITGSCAYCRVLEVGVSWKKLSWCLNETDWFVGETHICGKWGESMLPTFFRIQGSNLKYGVNNTCLILFLVIHPMRCWKWFENINYRTYRNVTISNNTYKL